MSNSWRVVYYPNGGFYMVWKGLNTDWKEYKSREEAQKQVEHLTHVDKMNEETAHE